ncbi:hypothetical protein K4B79_06390 [Streptomyces lincolnensis]|uniref:hypothetical protein n=1 Tax=Streptomyces lincolnensis TaxID=1915 RepID=UPI001E5462A3|nr:hypothetical protein [Streptomyces lincolnensis]MCD7437853.1 hypothetical protein [Streptomyces lincolnensis]
MIEGAIAGVVTTTLTEGVRFLYQQAQELISSWRRGRTAETTGTPPEGVFLGELRLVPDDPSVLDEHADAFVALLSTPGLVRVHVGESVDPEDEDQLRAVAELRALLERVSGRRITFAGEPGREPSGTTVVRGTATADVVHGRQAGVAADEIGAGADVTGESSAKDVGPGGESYGVRARRIGGR